LQGTVLKIRRFFQPVPAFKNVYKPIFFSLIKEMKEKFFYTIVGITFALVGFLHLLRAFLEWEVLINQYIIPIWVSYIIGLFAVFLSYKACILCGNFKTRKKHKK